MPSCRWQAVWFGGVLALGVESWLLVEFGPRVKRFREFVTFHSEYVYPEYVIAYQRFNGKTKVT